MTAGPVEIAILVVLVLLGLGVVFLTFRPAFRGPEAARAAIGTHRLAAGAIVSVLFVNALLTIPLAPFLQKGGFTTTTFVIAALSTDIPMLLFVYFRLVVPGAVTWQELGFVRKSPGYILRMGLGGGIVGLVIVDVIGTLLSQVGLRPNQLEQFEFVLNEGPLAFVALLVAAGIVAPIVEELFFRGFLFGLYRRRQPIWLAYVVSSLVFTVLHLEPNRMNLPQMAGLSVGIFLLATVLAWLYQHTGSLYPGILAHAVNNATGLILFYVVGVR